MAAQQKNAYYRIYNGDTREWDYYFFKTTAGQVITDNTVGFINSATRINGQAFTFTNDGANATLTMTGAHIENGVANNGHYIVAGANLNATLSALDTAAYNAAQSASGYLPLTGGTITGSLSNTAPLIIDIPSSGSTHSSEAFIQLKTYGTSGKFGIVLGFPTFEFDDGTQEGILTTGRVTTSVTQNSTELVTSGAVWSAIDNLPEPMVFKGSLGTGGTVTDLPTAGSSNEGYVYKVITAGTYASQLAKVGDTFICAKTGTSTYEWVLIPSGDEPSGTVTNVATGTGLTGGPITSSGTISVDTSWLSTQINTALGSYLPLAGNSNSTPMTGTIYVKQGTKTDPSIRATGTVGDGTPFSLCISSYNEVILHSDDDFICIDAGAYMAKLGTNGLSQDRSFSFPDASGVLATREWTTSNFPRVTVQTGSTAPSYTGLKSGDIWIN